MLFGPTSENSIFSARIVKLWSGEQHVKNSIQNVITIPTIKRGDDSVMDWGCFIRQKVGKLCVLDRIMNRFYYRDILEQNLQSSTNHFKLGQRCIFMGDNDPKHTSGLIKDWLKRKRIQTLPWLSYSTSFNPIENLWDELERRVKKHQPKNITQL